MDDTSPILIVGASGTTGGRLLGELRAAGVAVRAVSRTSVPAFDWFDPSTHEAALPGVRAAYVVPPPGTPDPAAVMNPFLDLAVARGVRRVVLLGAAAVAEGAPGVGQVHAHLRRTVPEWTVLRPSWFMQNLLPGHYLGDGVLAGDAIRTSVGDGRVAFVDPADIARVAAAALTAPAPLLGELVLTGPAALAYDEVAAILAEASGRPIRHERVSTEEVVELMARAGIPRRFAGPLAAFERELAAGAEDRVSAAVPAVTGRPATGLAAFARAHLAELRGEAGDAAPSVYLDHLRAVTGGPVDGLRAAWEPDGILEFPYAASLRLPARHEGIEAIHGYFSDLDLFDAWELGPVRARRIAGAPEYVVEFHGSSRLRTTGAPYEQDYVVCFGLSPRGRIAWMREFWDPTRAGG